MIIMVSLLMDIVVPEPYGLVKKRTINRSPISH